ncbi:MAG: hypothetical protein J4F33_04255, partial [Alphaproteobacteria bacterium]|nr:hypothetical protein [Alphaproteobacteria bacterium]
MAGYVLDYVALVARNVEATCRFLGGSLALERKDVALGTRSIPFFGVGQAAVAVFELDDPYLEEPLFPGVHHMALRADDPAGTAARHGLSVTAEGSGVGGRRFAIVEPKETVGIRTRFVEPLDIPSTDGPAYKIDHLGIASDDNNGGVRVFVDNLGCPLDSTQTDVEVRVVTESFISDKYDLVYHSRPAEILGGLRDVFIDIGDCALEFLMDYDPSLTPKDRLGEDSGNTKGDQSAIAKFVARRGAGLAHVAFATREIDARLPKLSDDGWRRI